MSKIFLLDEQTACRIAAGEVVERPASVVKELVENAIDAGATSISVAIGGGGIDYITVIDNGIGMSQEDVPLAFQRHATSKISNPGDLDKIATLGFRGEALPGIASVANLSIKTRVIGNNEGYHMRIQGGQILESGPVGSPIGTRITVRDIFFNTPARRKHLKSKATEGGLINDLVSKIALTNPGIRFNLEHNGRQVLRTPGSGKLIDALVSLYGLNTTEMMVSVYGKDNGVTLEGYVGKPELSRSTRQHITLAVNGRMIRYPGINNALDEAYKGLLTVGRYPVAILLFAIPLEMVDVNVHPSKMEIKIDLEDELTTMVTTNVQRALQGVSLIPGFKPKSPSEKILPASTEPYQLNLDQTPPDTLACISRVNKTIVGNRSALPIDSRAESSTYNQQQIAYKNNSKPLSSKDQESLAETKSSYQEQKRAFPQLQVVGQLLNTYIIAEDVDNVYFIDQHAAHERILFEKYYSYIGGGSPEIQYLITPVHISLKSLENDFLRDYLVVFNTLGFVFECFGRDSLLLRGTPADYSPTEGEQLFIDMLETLMETGKVSNDRIHYKIASMMACKASVKGGHRMSMDGMQVLLNLLARCEEPYTCPHGRPTIVTISRRELDHMFKRT